VIGALADDTSGVALTEFAFTAPIFLTLGLVGSDTVSYVIVHMRISQVALHVADNASRIGEQDVLTDRRIFERDINDLLTGAERYAKGLDLNANGRIILSSLEMNDEGGQWIHWQRCKGQKDHDSQYGVEGDGEEGDEFPGMGEPGAEITASGADEAVMFVEVAYDYQPLGPLSTLEGKEITYTASFNVRDNRDLSQIHPDNPVGVTASCD
jgi:hypothetical protein